LVALLDGDGVAGAAASNWTVLNDPLAEKMMKNLIAKNCLENDETCGKCPVLIYKPYSLEQ
jgi:hypothetical protein